MPVAFVGLLPTPLLAKCREAEPTFSCNRNGVDVPIQRIMESVSLPEIKSGHTDGAIGRSPKTTT